MRGPTWTILHPASAALALRQAATLPEERLWQAVRGGALGVKIRRQHPIGRYIADFACAARKVVIELDGPVHDLRLSEDAERTGAIERLGWSVMRIPNRRVMEELYTVLEELRAALGQREVA